MGVGCNRIQGLTEGKWEIKSKVKRETEKEKEGKEKWGEKGGVTKNTGGWQVKMDLTAYWETGYDRPYRKL